MTRAAEQPIAVVRPSPRLEGAFGVVDGLYEPGYLDDLRADERA